MVLAPQIDAVIYQNGLSQLIFARNPPLLRASLVELFLKSSNNNKVPSHLQALRYETNITAQKKTVSFSP